MQMIVSSVSEVWKFGCGFGSVSVSVTVSPLKAPHPKDPLAKGGRAKN